MSSEDYKEFDDAAFTKFRKSLLRTKGGSRQQEFLMIVRKNKSFLDFISENIPVDGSQELPLCTDPLTENEFKNPPIDTEKNLYSAWRELTPRIACRTTFWANMTFRHIESGRIDSVYLAADGGGRQSGSERIDLLLKDDGDTDAKSVDDCVRTVLRRLGGLPEARGNRTVYVDCPLARAWWRERMVADISGGDEKRASLVRDVTRVSQSYWEELVTLVVSRNSVLGSAVVRNAFVVSLAGLLAKEPESRLRTGKELRLACRAIGAVQASRELSVLDDNEIRELMDGIVRSQHERASARSAG